MISIFSTKVTASLGFYVEVTFCSACFFSSGFMIDFCAETPVLGAYFMLGDFDYCVDGLFFRESLSDSLM
jgi:hypothetical protein